MKHIENFKLFESTDDRNNDYYQLESHQVRNHLILNRSVLSKRAITAISEFLEDYVVSDYGVGEPIDHDLHDIFYIKYNSSYNPLIKWFIRICELEDEYFIIDMLHENSKGGIGYKCDQLDGLFKIMELFLSREHKNYEEIEQKKKAEEYALLKRQMEEDRKAGKDVGNMYKYWNIMESLDEKTWKEIGLTEFEDKELSGIKFNQKRYTSQISDFFKSIPSIASYGISFDGRFFRARIIGTPEVLGDSIRIIELDDHYFLIESFVKSESGPYTCSKFYQCDEFDGVMNCLKAILYK